MKTAKKKTTLTKSETSLLPALRLGSARLTLRRMTHG
jgi:hypothetical protein